MKRRFTSNFRSAEPFSAAPSGQSAIVDSYNEDATLEQSEGLDSDEVRNLDGDEVADPPDEWISADEDESLDDKLMAETSDNPHDDRPSRDSHELAGGRRTGRGHQ